MTPTTDESLEKLVAILKSNLDRPMVFVTTGNEVRSGTLLGVDTKSRVVILKELLVGNEAISDLPLRNIHALVAPLWVRGEL